ncbi:MAG: hypothetical protein ABIG43_05800 [Chloroflexota bacterium]
MVNTPTVKKDDALYEEPVVLEGLEDMPEKKKGKKTILIIVIVAVVLLLCCCCLIAISIGFIPMIDGYDYYDFGYLLPLMGVV